MDSAFVTSLLVLSGVCAYAAVRHFSVAWHRPGNLTHRLFAGMCLTAVLFGVSHVQVYRATTLVEFVVALKWNISFIVLTFMLFPWFIAEFTGLRPRRWLVASNMLFAALFLINLFQPYSLQFAELSGLEALRLPWGETIAHPVGRTGAGFGIGSLLVLTNIGFALYALGVIYRRNRARTILAMLLAVGVYLVTAIEGVLARASMIDFVPLGPFGFLAMVIVMSALLDHETGQRLRDSERRFRSLVEQSPFSIQVLSPAGLTRQVNAAWEKLWGVRADSLGDYNILHDRQLRDKGVMPYIEEAFSGKSVELPPIIYNPADNPVVRGPVRDRWVRAYIYPIKDEVGGIRDVILMHEDVTGKKRVEDAIRLIAAGVSAATGERFFQQLVQSLAQLFDADYAFIGTVDGRDAQRIDTLTVWAHGQTAPNISYALADTPCATVMGQGTCAYPHGVQQLFPKDRLLVEMGAEGYIGTPLFDARGEPLGLLVVLDGKPLVHIEQVWEILEIFAARAGAELARLRAEAHIRRMAYRDYLTDLANRAQLHERLTEVLGQARRSRTCGALLLIDLDHFKTINDALSHDVGDDVLRAVGHRLDEVVGGRALVARPGGDEFAVLMELGSVDIPTAERVAHELAQKIMDKLSSPILLGERAFSIGASIGVVLFPANGESELDILRHAEMALYRAKGLGRGNIQFYVPSLQTAAATRLQLEEGLRRVIANDELALYFQPQLDAGGRMIGAEALLRWRHPELGDIPPDTFIPVAEETGLIHSIGRWVFDRACSQLNAWLRAGVPFSGHLSINVCPWQFARPDFVQMVSECIARHQIDPDLLMLELTETALLYDLEGTVRKLETLRALGLHVSLDDFGTGYSSLAYLKDLPLDQIKIDKTFIGELDRSKDHSLVETMIAIGRHMHLAIIAEGVESAAQHDILLGLGCEGFQGFLFCRPLPEEEFLAWLSERA
ncbi:MAG: EAL domain-containing protein [Gammaproteobacteria bacterium]|nr:EAL domain-containing protein [Gammaproteobacteria bacterium]